jgi:hypothetical protein
LGTDEAIDHDSHPSRTLRRQKHLDQEVLLGYGLHLRTRLSKMGHQMSCPRTGQNVPAHGKATWNSCETWIESSSDNFLLHMNASQDVRVECLNGRTASPPLSTPANSQRNLTRNDHLRLARTQTQSKRLRNRTRFFHLRTQITPRLFMPSQTTPKTPSHHPLAAPSLVPAITCLFQKASSPLLDSGNGQSHQPSHLPCRSLKAHSHHHPTPQSTPQQASPPLPDLSTLLTLLA